MKKIKSLCGILLVITTLFSSCSRDDTLSIEKEKAYLSFRTFLNDSSQKQQNNENSSRGNCSSAIPAFVDIVLNNKGIQVAGTETSPLRLKLLKDDRSVEANGGPEDFTEVTAALELLPGIYTLEYFKVLDEKGKVMWEAPINSGMGGMDKMLRPSLPLEITLSPGLKKIQEVGVICFKERNDEDNGDLFNEISGIQIIEFCIFGNYCYETGRHAEFILFKVDVWKYSGDPWSPKGIILHEDLQNEVMVTDYEEYSEINSFPLCLTLPDGPGVDEYYIEITQINLGAEDILIRSGLFSDGDVRSLFRDNGTMEYYHFTEGECNIDDEPVLLNDPRDITGTWEFHMVFGGDALTTADVVFYPDGTASYNDYWYPDDPVWGTWAYLDNSLFYDPDGQEDILGFVNFSGNFIQGKLSGTFWYDGYKNEWSAERKID